MIMIKKNKVIGMKTMKGKKQTTEQKYILQNNLLSNY